MTLIKQEDNAATIRELHPHKQADLPSLSPLSCAWSADLYDPRSPYQSDKVYFLEAGTGSRHAGICTNICTHFATKHFAHTYRHPGNDDVNTIIDATDPKNPSCCFYVHVSVKCTESPPLSAMLATATVMRSRGCL